MKTDQNSECVDKNAKNGLSQTPYDVAKINGNKNIMNLLSTDVQTVKLSISPKKLPLIDKEDITTDKNKTNAKNTTSQLPKLSGWLEKKSNSLFKGWEQRYFVVKDNYLLWSSKEQTINNVDNKKERNKFNNYIRLLLIKSIKPINKDKNEKFEMTVKLVNKKNKDTQNYEIKAKTTNERNFWVNSLKLHIDHFKKMESYISDSEKE